MQLGTESRQGGRADCDVEVSDMAMVTRTEAGQIAVTSQLIAWWLINFKGYRVRMQTLVPRRGIFKRIRYCNTWLLERSGENNTGKIM